MSKKPPTLVAGRFISPGAPWAQREGEPASAYSLFLRFLEMPRRSYKRFAKTILKRKSVPPKLMEVAQKYVWEDRAESWDSYKANLRREAMERKEVRSATAESEITRDLVLTTWELVRRFRKSVRDDPKKVLGPRDLREFAVTSVTLRRLLRDQATSITGRVALKAREELKEKLEGLRRDLKKVDAPVTPEKPAPSSQPTVTH